MKFTQIGWATLGILAVGLGVMGAMQPVGHSALWLPIILLGIVGLLFGWLTVEIDADTVWISFGVGIIRRSWPLANVASARPVRNPVWTGFGIRIGPSYTLYNVSGRDAVELKFVDGSWSVRIGTGQPAALADAITTCASNFRNPDSLPLLSKAT